MVLVIGYGNPLRQDDGVGWRVAQRVESLTALASNVNVALCYQLTPELAEALSSARLAIFIDASVEGAAGEVESRPIAPYSGPVRFDAHQFGPAELLALARQLYGRSPDAHLVTVTGQDFDIGSELSAPVRRSVRDAVELVVELTRAVEAEL